MNHTNRLPFPFAIFLEVVILSEQLKTFIKCVIPVKELYVKHEWILSLTQVFELRILVIDFVGNDSKIAAVPQVSSHEIEHYS